MSEAISTYQIFDLLPAWVRQRLKEVIANDEDLSNVYYAWKTGDERYLRDTLAELEKEAADLHRASLGAMSAAENYKPREDAAAVRMAYLQGRGEPR